MSFQSEVNSNIQALGNAGQIAKGYHSYCNIVDCVTSENISVGEFAQTSTTNDNEVLSTANGLYFRNFAENLDNSVPDYTALRERNATDGLFGIADRNLGTAKIIAVKVIGL